MYKCYIQILLKQKQNIFIKMKVPNMHNFTVTCMILLSSLNHQLPVSCFYCAVCHLHDGDEASFSINKINWVNLCFCIRLYLCLRSHINTFTVQKRYLFRQASAGVTHKTKRGKCAI